MSEANADYRTHLMHRSTMTLGEELLSWRCVRCEKWIKEYGPTDRSRCRTPSANDGSVTS
jgi:hypothetical protein